MTLEEEVKQLKNNWETLYKFLEDTNRLKESDCVMLIDLMDDIRTGFIK